MNGNISAKKESDLGDARKIATPLLLRKGLQVFLRNGRQEPLYVVLDPANQLQWELETRQFFILEMMQVDEEFVAIAASYERRFAQMLSRGELDAMLVNLIDQRLLGLAAAAHPLVAQYREQLQEDLQRLLEEKVARFRDKATPPARREAAAPAPAPISAAPLKTAPPSNAASASGDAGRGAGEPLQAGVRDAAGMDDTLQIPVLHLFNPHGLLKSLQGWLEPLRYGVFVLPLLFGLALGILLNNYGQAHQDATRLLSGFGAVGQVLFSLFTVNLLCTLTLALTAQRYRGTVYSLSLAFMLGFLPRFMPRIRHLVGLSRRERLWLHGGPVLMRLALFSLGVFTWYLSRASNGAFAGCRPGPGDDQRGGAAADAQSAVEEQWLSPDRGAGERAAAARQGVQGAVRPDQGRCLSRSQRHRPGGLWPGLDPVLGAAVRHRPAAGRQLVAGQLRWHRRAGLYGADRLPERADLSQVQVGQRDVRARHPVRALEAPPPAGERRAEGRCTP